MIKRIKRPEAAQTTSSLFKSITHYNSIPVHITFKNSQRTFAEASGTIVLDSVNDYDTKLIFKGVNVKSFLEQLNLPKELGVCIYV